MKTIKEIRDSKGIVETSVGDSVSYNSETKTITVINGYHPGNQFVVTDEQLKNNFEDIYFRRAGRGKKIRITTDGPKLISFWDIYGKELDVKDTKTVNFASGPKTFYITEFEGREYEVPEDMVEKRTNKELSEYYWKKAEALEEELASDRGGETSGMNYERAERLQKEMDYYRNLSIELEGKAGKGKMIYKLGDLIVRADDSSEFYRLNKIGSGFFEISKLDRYGKPKNFLNIPHDLSTSETYRIADEDEIKEFESGLSDEFASNGKKVNLGIAIKGEFTTDGKNYFSGWYFQSQDWNGFKVPYFEDKEAREVIESAEGLSVGRLYGGKLSDKGWWYAEPGTAPADRTVITGQKIQTTDGEKEVWSIGGFEWTWGLKDEFAGNGSQIKRVGIYTDEKLEELAKRHFPGLETLQTRKMDSLDFHDVAVWQIKSALKEAGRDMLSDSELLEIAKNHLYLDTLTTRNSDGLDFSEQAVWAIKDALKEANYKGVEKLRKAGDGAKIEKMENKYYYLKPKALFKDSGGVTFEITGHTPTSLKARRFSDVEKNTPEIEIPYTEVLDLVSDKKMVFEKLPIDKIREFRLLEMEIENIKLNFHHKDSIKTYQAELEQAADKIDKLNAELHQVKKEANTLMDDLGKKSSGFKDSLDAMEAIAKKEKKSLAQKLWETSNDKERKKMIRRAIPSMSLKYSELGWDDLTNYIQDELNKTFNYGKAGKGKEVEAGEASVYVELINGNIKVYHGSDFKAKEKPYFLLKIKNAKHGSWDKIWDALRKIKSGHPKDGGVASIYIELSKGNITVYHGSSFELTGSKNELLSRDGVVEGSWLKIWEVLDGIKKASKAGKGKEVVSPCTDCDTKLKAFIAKFPNNAKSWAQATDEMRDLARELREYYNEQNDLAEGEKGYIDGLPFREFKKPSEWNTKAKKQILSTWKKLSKEQKEDFASNNSFLNPDND